MNTRKKPNALRFKLTVKITEPEREAFKGACIKNNTDQSKIIRDYVAKYVQKSNIVK